MVVMMLSHEDHIMHVLASHLFRYSPRRNSSLANDLFVGPNLTCASVSFSINFIERILNCDSI